MKFNTVPPSMWQKPSHFIAFGLGSGAMPVAPGTFGTLMSIPFFLLLQHLPVCWYVILLILLTYAAIKLCDTVQRELKVHDHHGMVIDEFIGYWVTMIAAPRGWGWVILGFILFRIFDIWKPGPIGWLDRNARGGFGVIIDDVAAGVVACIVLQLIALF